MTSVDPIHSQNRRLPFIIIIFGVCCIAISIVGYYHHHIASSTKPCHQSIRSNEKAKDNSQSVDDSYHINDAWTLVLSNEHTDDTDDKDDGDDDDLPKDKTCRRYLMQFLNDTTDNTDVCQGMYAAWQAGHCQQEENTFHNFRLGTDDIDNNNNSNDTDDSILLDDYYENFECCHSINAYYTKHCQDSHLDATKMLAIMAVLMLCGIVKSALKVANIPWVPDAGACILVGSFVALVLHGVAPGLIGGRRLAFDNDLFLQVLLPPIIFEAALSIDKRAFRRDIFPILMFAIGGTFFSAIVIGILTYQVSNLGHSPGLPLLDSLIFGALMSSIDPVTTLGILSSIGISQHETLYTIIFGESLLNDGVSIVLFDSLIRHMGDSDVLGVASIHDTVLHFLVMISGSILIGFVCAVMATSYFWALKDLNSAVTETAMFFTAALIPYYIADAIGLSGIISIMVMGFMMDYFVIGGFQSEESGWMEYMEMHGTARDTFWVSRLQASCRRVFSGGGHILSKTRTHVKFVAEVISSLMETAIFAYLGLFLFNDKNWNISLTLTGLMACLSSRAVMVVAFGALINLGVWLDLEGLLCRLFHQRRQPSNESSSISSGNDTRVYLDRKTQAILFTSGIRGAVSYALVSSIPVYNSVTKTGSHYKGELKAMTSAIIVVLIFVLGGLTYYTARYDMGATTAHGGTLLTERLISRESILASDDAIHLDDHDDNDDDVRETSSLEIESHE